MSEYKPYPKPIRKEKRPRISIKRTAIKKKYKATGEKLVFKLIWDSRPHICANCKIPLGDTAHTYNFAHIVRKSRSENERLNPANISLHCLTCHMERDQGTKEKYEARTNLYAP